MPEHAVNHEAAHATPRCVPKLCGADVELGNFILGRGRAARSGREASRALLREIDAPYVTHGGPLAARPYDPQDWGRKFLRSNGGCFYIDSDHLECALPEVRSAWDHVAAWHAMLRIARRALIAANTKLPSGQTIQVLVNNSDGKGHAYGSHLNFLVTRRAWDDVFERKLHHLLFLAAFQVSSIVFTGQGKVGAENDRPDTAFQLSQRADFFETLVGPQTTYHRPIVNSRDEPLCGSRPGVASGGRPAADLARLHCIFFDSTVAHGSSLLKVGTTQLILALLEAEQVNPALILDDPVNAVVRWSHDPTLATRVRLASGDAVTAIELQMRFLEEAQRFAATGGYDGIVPRASELLAYWEDTLLRLRAGDLASLAPRLDWVLKLHLIRQAMAARPDSSWSDPQIKYLDHMYANLDAESGLYWACEAMDAVERVVGDDEIERFVLEPPDDTRAWGRAMLLRRAAPDQVQDVDWDRICFRQGGRGHWPTLHPVHMDDPLGFTRAAIGDVVDGARSLDEILDAFAAAPTYDTTPTLWRNDDEHLPT